MQCSPPSPPRPGTRSRPTRAPALRSGPPATPPPHAPSGAKVLLDGRGDRVRGGEGAGGADRVNVRRRDLECAVRLARERGRARPRVQPRPRRRLSETTQPTGCGPPKRVWPTG